MRSFTAAERDYLTGATGSRRLGRVATVGADGTPHVVPVGFSVRAEEDAIEVRGRAIGATKKFRDVRRAGRAAIVVDDLASTDPWHPRGVEVRGRADAVEALEALIRIQADRVVSWGLEG